ncbi:DNA-directed RNA polymerase subunit beta [Neobacillus rhizosphaerae]|uniref:DNA-directed RNA polymerase subunit beta n=1 Tax=Neobacillus rhizosphaerae TaxID=2880965 RepID=UPI003D26CF3E
MSVNNQAKTREEFKRAKYEEQQKMKDEKQKAKDEKAMMKKDRVKVERTNEKVEAAPHTYKRIRIRLIPIWLRLVLLVVFTFVSLLAGATVGYGILGGGKVADVFKQSTWTHIQDLVDKK